MNKTNFFYSRGKLLSLIIVLITFYSLSAQQIAILKYDGGGDWYSNPTALPNLISFCNKNINTNIESKVETVEADSNYIYNYPIVFMTGHGNVYLNENAVQNLRNYLISGGFLHISDNYGMDSYIRREMKKVFPELGFQEIPFDHPIYHQVFDFDALPKIHEHNDQPSEGLGIFYEGRLLCFYDYESDLNDGWEDENIHNDSYEIRLKALQMGANIVAYVFKY